jgi:glutamate-1-semialdehyde aminotransferase
VRAIHDQALLGNHFLLPTTDSMDVCRLLTERFGLPQWQFTLSATGANTDAIRIARVATGRSTVLVFDGKYHGHLDQTLWSRGNGENMAPDLTGRFSAAELAKAAVIAMGGQGAGGKPDFAQGGAPDDSKAAEGVAAVKALLA